MARRMQRTLDLNPIIWLQQYSWKARLTKWALCLVVVLVDGSALSDRYPDFESLQYELLLLLAVVMTVAGVSSFLAEKRSGALELILVTPLRSNEIIFGRVWGLWKLILPSAVVLFASHFARACLEAPSSGAAEHFFLELTFSALVFLNLPLLSTYFALRQKNLFRAAVLTWMVLLLPLLSGYVLMASVVGPLQAIPFDTLEMVGGAVGLVCLLGLIMTFWSWFALAESLAQRRYGDGA
jgi:ABC-type Na+ efflux pump permease subunit